MDNLFFASDARFSKISKRVPKQRLEIVEKCRLQWVLLSAWSKPILCKNGHL